ncbi:uncharacterized protein B0H64DRAFT_355079 [Chaetomium fimeti]|uniref:Uncharacterized protein n=1 Tax=Chaetomium fimeti TaxID=1854472 RepID=A0AAE0HMD4_9PEZI|nr:hypothetical protein B0H64DRAFT_355079 [Chaetomium fimeti]
MAPTASLVLPREGEDGSGNLTAGAIAGIACGAGALFLGAAALFVIYWRRQRRYDREDNSDGESFDETGPQGAMPAVTYTMDYKMDNPQHHEGDQGSSYTYSPEKASYSFSPSSAPDTASAMPTHPAYIPRALVRGSTPSNRSIATASPPPFPSPPFPSGGSHPKTQPPDAMIQAYMGAAIATNSRTPSTTTSQTHGSINNNHHHHTESDSSLGLPIQPAPRGNRSRQPSPPSLTLPPFTSPPHSASSTDASQQPLHPQSQPQPQPPPQPQPQANRKPRAYLPPRLNLADGTAPKRSKTDKPISGKEATTISGPLAFPHLVHPPPAPAPQHQPHQQQQSRSYSRWGRSNKNDDDADDLWGGEDGYDEPGYSQSQSQSDSRRTFRSRAMSGNRDGQDGGGQGSGSGGGGGGGKGEGEGKGKGKKHGRKRSDRNSGGFAGNRHYAEIEIGRGSDIW